MGLTPDPVAGESADDLVARCIPTLREDGKTEKEARIISHSIYNRSQRLPDLGTSLAGESVLGFPEMEKT